MKKLIVTTFALLLAACTQTNTSGNGMMQGGMMQGDMMKNCQEMMKEGKMQCQCPCCQKMMDGGMMKDGMKMDMQQCQKMMKQSGAPMQSSPAKKAAPSGVSTEDHKQHHPAQ